MSTIKKIFYYLRLIIALVVFTGTIIVSVSYFTGNNFLNLPFEQIENYIMQDVLGFTLKSMAIIAVITLIFGRIWCSLICPVGIFQEIVWLVSRREGEPRPSYFYKYILLAITVLVLFFFYNPIMDFINSHLIMVIISGIVSMVLIAVLTIFKGRFFCTDICPFGALYGLISKFSLFRIYQGEKDCMSCSMCEYVCPSGCIESAEDKVNNVTCVRCFRCFNACSENGMKYGIHLWKKK